MVGSICEELCHLLCLIKLMRTWGEARLHQVAWYTRRRSSGRSWGWRPRCRPGKLSFRLQSCCSVAQSCLTLCDPMNSSTLGFPVFHHLPEYAQTHVHRVGDAIQPSHPLSPTPPPPALSLSSIRVFSSESDLLIRWPKYWSFRFSISPSSEFSGLISFKMNWFDLLHRIDSLIKLCSRSWNELIRKWAATLSLLVFPLTLTIIKMISLGPLCPLASYLLSRPLLSCSHFFPHFCVCSHCPLLINHWNIPITYIEDFKTLFVSHARPFILWLYLMQQLPFPVSTRCPLISGFLLLRGVQPGHIVSFALRCFPSDGTQVAQWWRVHLQCKSPRRRRFDPWVGKFPWRRARQPTPIFLPGESRGQRSLAAYSP